MRSREASQQPWVLPVVPYQWAAGHAPPSLAWRKVGGGGVAINHQFKKGSQPPSGVVLGSVIQRGGKKKKKKRGEIICYFFRLGWTTAFLCWEGSERVNARWLHVRLYRRSHVHRAIGHHDSECPASVFSN